jgi:hypothetical protein
VGAGLQRSARWSEPIMVSLVRDSINLR